MIEVRNLVKEFKLDKGHFRAIDNVSFTVEKGEIYGIIGLSGAGKSTLVRCLNRLEEPTSGEIYIEGINITNLKKEELLKERKDIGMIFQSFNLFSQKTVFENIAYPLRISNISKDEIEKRVKNLLEFIDLEDKINAYPSEISGGQKQRVAIARAIATNPKILLSDEGTSALDPENTKQILNLLKRTVDTFGMTIIMITHQMEVAKDICDRIAVMESGKIIEENTVEELFKHPKEERTRSFIRSLQDSTEEEVIFQEDFTGKAVRLTYDENTVKKPLISESIKLFGIDVNLISGNINKLTDTSVGYMIVELQGEEDKITQAIDFLVDNGVIVEVI